VNILRHVFSSQKTHVNLSNGTLVKMIKFLTNGSLFAYFHTGLPRVSIVSCRLHGGEELSLECAQAPLLKVRAGFFAKKQLNIDEHDY
jgi:hypothetical protein